MGIDGFSVMLRRAEKQEAEFAAGNFKKAKCVPPPLTVLNELARLWREKRRQYLRFVMSPLA